MVSALYPAVVPASKEVQPGSAAGSCRHFHWVEDCHHGTNDGKADQDKWPWILGLWPFSFWLHWVLGAMAVDAYFGNCQLPKWCSSLFVGIVVAMAGVMVNVLTSRFLASTQLGATWGLNWQSVGMFRLSSVGELAFPLAFFGHMNCVVQPENQVLFRNRFFETIASLGKVSYSVNLVHLPTIYLMEKLVPLGYSVGDWRMRMVIYVSTVFMVGTVFYFLVERWFLAGRCPVIWRSTKPVTSLGN